MGDHMLSEIQSCLLLHMCEQCLDNSDKKVVGLMQRPASAASSAALHEMMELESRGYVRFIASNSGRLKFAVTLKGTLFYQRNKKMIKKHLIGSTNEV